MKVQLMSQTFNAKELLAFTKNTRLELDPNLMEEIKNWSPERMQEELHYIARTIRSSHEFVDYTFLISGVSRAFTHQLVRTRVASFAQQSMRVTNMCDYEYIMPDRYIASPVLRDEVDRINTEIRKSYQKQLELGAAAEDARGILPTNIATNIVMKINLRNLADLLRSRLGGRTQGEYRRVARGMMDAVLDVHPWAYDFIFPNEGVDFFDKIEEFAEEQFGGDLLTKGKLLKIVDSMRGVK